MVGSESGSSTEEVARGYFAALAQRDSAAMAEFWAQDGIEHIFGFADLTGPQELQAYFQALFEAVPDSEWEVLSTTVEGNRCAVRWRMRGIFAGPGTFQGFEPTGSKLDIEGLDLITVADGQIVRNDAYTDGAEFARQIGTLPEAGSKAEQRLTALANVRTRAGRTLGTSEPEQVADGVWVVRGGFPLKTMNVYLIEGTNGVTVFDAGIKAMSAGIAAAAARMGGIERVVLGHGHQDHRGAAPFLEAPVYCHGVERADAETDGGAHYFTMDTLDLPARWLMPKLLAHWDGGPVKIEGTVEEGDDVAGFKVVHLPGHAPGLIGLWRESDRLALVSDCFYTLDPQTGIKGHARVPLGAFNQDTEEARRSILKLAEMEPAAAWAGHADPIVGDVRSTLEIAARDT